MDIYSILNKPNVEKYKDFNNPTINILDTSKYQYYMVPQNEYVALIAANSKSSKQNLFEIIQDTSCLCLQWKYSENPEARNEQLIEYLMGNIAKYFNVAKQSNIIFFTMDDITGAKLIMSPSIIMCNKYKQWLLSMCNDTAESIYTFGSVPKTLLGFRYTHAFHIKAAEMRAWSDEISKYQPVEQSVNFNVDTPSISRYFLEPREEYDLDVEDFEVDNNDDFNYHEQIAKLSHDAVLTFFYNIVDMLPIDTEYTFIIKCLLNSGNMIYDRYELRTGYDTIARYFYTKYLRLTGREFNIAEYNELKIKLNLESTVENKIHLIMLAKRINPDKFQLHVDELCIHELTEKIVIDGCTVQSGCAARIAYHQYGYKYLVNMSQVKSTEAGGHWYMFNEEYDKNNEGRIYKWEALMDLSMIKYNIQMLNRYVIAAKQRCIRDCKLTKENQKSFKAILNSLESITFINNVIKQLEIYCSGTKYIMLMNKFEYKIGVANGVLDLASPAGPRLLTGVHTIPISFTTFTHCDPAFSMEDKYVKKNMDIMRTIIPQPDALEMILCYCASALANKPGDPLMIIIDGVGRNGKTCLLEMIRGAIGREYRYDISIGILSDQFPASDRPNPALMEFMNKIFVSCEESKKGTVLNTQAIKTILGTISTRNVYEGKQTYFASKARIMAMTNYTFKIDDLDQGSWRRLKRYKCTTRFTENPSAADEHKVDTEIYNTYINSKECHNAMLTILIYYYYKFVNLYKGNIHNINSPTINRYTQEYRNDQDKINLFITSHVLVAKNPPAPQDSYRVTLISIIQEYISWYGSRFGKISMSQALLDEFNMSVLNKYVKEDTEQHEIYVINCRSITQNVGELVSGQISENERRI